eukprot:4377962-Amphidinium_carterae.1
MPTWCCDKRAISTTSKDARQHASEQGSGYNARTHRLDPKLNQGEQAKERAKGNGCAQATVQACWIETESCSTNATRPAAAKMQGLKPSHHIGAKHGRKASYTTQRQIRSQVPHFTPRIHTV